MFIPFSFINVILAYHNVYLRKNAPAAKLVRFDGGMNTKLIYPSSKDSL